jgi:putative transposase
MLNVKGRSSHMASPNVIREYAEDQYYHLFNRGVEKRLIFQDEQDYAAFLGLLKKYLTGENHNKKNRHVFQPLGDRVQLLAYCLMPNHFHLLLYQSDKEAITQLMRRVCTGYVMYFNNRYQRVGSLFQGRYKASAIDKDAYLHHISRYIHLNPEDYESWPYSSLVYYKGKKKATWVSEKPILQLFNNDRQEYLNFIKDYKDSKAELSVLKWQLADSSK